ncbi:MAG: acyltransferase [Phycisphaerales bacterium]|nr:acyltransferase [Phycisphaerales bacterium]
MSSPEASNIGLSVAASEQSSAARSLVGVGTHVPALDGIRGLAILLVMIFHMNLLAGASRVDHAARFISSAGWTGVDLFFVLSGFLITGILLDTKHGKGYFRLFYARRALRIFPLYYAVVAFSLIVLPAVAAHLPPVAQAKLDRFGTIGSDGWMYWAYLSNFAIASAEKFRHGILDISWSLAIEEQFYLVWPAVVYLLSREKLLYACVGAIFFAIGFRCYLVWHGAHPIAVHLLTPSRIDALAVGAFIAAAIRGPGGLEALLRIGRPLALAAFAIVTLGLGYRFLSNTGRPGEEGFASANLPEIQTVGLTLIAVAFGGLLVHVVAAAGRGSSLERSSRASWIVRFFESGLLRALGKYSYAMYLFHQPVRAVIRDLVIPRSLMDGKVFASDKLWVAHSQILPQVVFTTASIAVTFALAWVSWHVFEKRCLAIKKYVEYKRA